MRFHFREATRPPAPWPWESSGETDPDAIAIILDGEDMDLFIPVSL